MKAALRFAPARALLLLVGSALLACYYTDKTEELVGGPADPEIQDEATGHIIVSLTATPPSVRSGYPSQLRWEAAEGAACSFDQGFGQVSWSGEFQVNPVATTTYTLSCSKSGEDDVKKVTVTITSPAQVCTPNSDESCTCSGGGHGSRTCASDGRSWGQCCWATCPC